MFWQLNYLRSSVFALLPGGPWLRTIKRKLIPYPAKLDLETFDHAFEMIAMLERAGMQPRGRGLLELGSGWRPIIPLIMRLAGADRVYLVDTQRLHRSIPGARALAGLRHLRVDRAFGAYRLDDLAILSSRFVARAAAS